MTFSSQITADESVFYNSDEFAESATYNGAEISVVEASTSEQATGDPGFMAALYAIYVKTSDVTQPEAGDAVTFRGVECRVQPYMRSEGKDWLVGLLRNVVQ